MPRRNGHLNVKAQSPTRFVLTGANYPFPLAVVSQRPVPAEPGMFIFNLSTDAYEGYVAGKWITLGDSGTTTADLSDEIAALEAGLSVAQSDIIQLKARVAAAENDIGALDTRLTTAEADIQLLEDANAARPLDYRDLPTITEPSAPPAGTIRMWFDGATLYVKDSTGANITVVALP